MFLITGTAADTLLITSLYRTACDVGDLERRAARNRQPIRYRVDKYRGKMRYIILY